MQIPLRYLPSRLTRKDKAKQIRALSKSRRMYKLGKYYSRNPLKSFQYRKSDHIVRATKMYGVERILPNKELAQKTGCSVNALNQIVKKGEGAYYSSGSRPNQTARSWGLARLASSITGGKASAVDYKILERGCNHRTSKAFRLAKPPKFGRRHTRRVDVHI
jgi:DNA-binding Xre family transcriptional regulator